MAPKIALCITIFTLLTGFTIIGKPPPARNVHVIVAATPTTDAIPKHKPKVLIESFPGARVHTHLVYSKVVAEMGKCTGEAAPYLKGIIDLKETLNGDDIVVFQHDHETAWHQPVRMQHQLRMVLSKYPAYSRQDFGITYCLTNAVFTGRGFADKVGMHVLWELLFGGTKWMSTHPRPNRLRFGYYPCCATFFVSGSLNRHTSDEYMQVYVNLLRFCQNSALVNQARDTGMKNVGAQLMEGVWHLMLANISHVPKAPWCQKREEY